MDLITDAKRTENISKEYLLSDKKVLAVSEKYIDELYYNDIFYSAACCNTAAAVDRNMKNLDSKSSKLLDLKYNIRVRVIGLGCKYLSTHWSKNIKAFTKEELTSHIKMIVSNQRSHSVPTKPSVLLPAKKSLLQIGTQAPDIVVMDAFFLETSDKFEHQ